MIRQLLFNPFQKIAGWKALLWGMVIMCVTAVVAIFSHCHFDGVIDVHIWKANARIPFFLEFLIDWGLVTLLFFLAGKILSRSKIRLLDVAGTTALARFPYFFVALICFGIPNLNPIDFQNLNDINYRELFPLIVFGLLSLVFSIWTIILLFQAFKISCNLKGAKLVIGFIVALVIAEIVSKIIFSILLPHF